MTLAPPPAVSEVVGTLHSLAGGEPEAAPALLVWPLALGLAAVHVFTPGLDVLESLPRPSLLSLGSGVSVAYVFVHLLPEVASVEPPVVHGEYALFPLEFPVYLLALAGFVAFYGLEHVARRWGTHGENGEATESTGVYWLHLGSFATYNVLLGYLLVERSVHERAGLVLFAVAIGLHLLVNDHGLREHHAQRYRQVGRWLLAGAVLLGAALGVFLVVGPPLFELLLAFLAGAVVFTVVKEELPSQGENRFSMFTLGVVGYAALLVVV